MVGIVITFLVALLGLFVLFASFLQIERTSKTDSPVPPAEAWLPGLSAAAVPDLWLFSGEDDYHRLCANPALRSIGGKFRQDRRRIILMWLSELEGDVRLLWEFRRFLVRNGLPVTLREEAGVASAGLTALFYLSFLRSVVFVFGPFALPGPLRKARRLVGLVSSRDAVFLARLPEPRRTEIAQLWAQHVLLLRAG